MSSEPIAVTVARAALCEAGRPDLARGVRANKIGVPSLRHQDQDHQVVVKAFLLGHLAAGHQARIINDGGGIGCDECWDASIAGAAGGVVGDPEATL
jgi:hypothetical protein